MPRYVAYACLRSGSPKPLLEVNRLAKLHGLDERDTALARHLVGTEIRRRATLRAVVAGFTHHKPKVELATLLRLGVAQLLYCDRIPTHAAVSSTVELATRVLGLSKSRVVNGVMRSITRSLQPGKSGDPTADLADRDVHFDGPVFRHPDKHPHLWAEDVLSIPSSLHKKWSSRFGFEGANQLAARCLEEPKLSIRLIRPEEVRLEFDGLGIELLPTTHPSLALAPSSSTGACLRSEAFKGGALTIQGEQAFRAAELMGDVRGKRVLELCAAPGGKSAVIASKNPALHVATDLAPDRLQSLNGLERLELPSPLAVAMDGTCGLRPGETFDAVFVDAPCSNTGVLAQRPSARWRYGPSSQHALVEIQSQLLAAAADRVAPGGSLVYSTCSLEPEENAQQIDRFLSTEPQECWIKDGVVESVPGLLDGGADPGIEAPVDGGFAARLIKRR